MCNLRILLPLKILREIKFGSFKGSKSAILAILKASNFDFRDSPTFESVKNYQKLKILSR